jgi:predicted nucleotidyltransferase
MNKEEIKKALVANRKILRKYKVSKMGIFGSYAKDKAKKRVMWICLSSLKRS